jgi:transposase InsO family protein
VSAEKEVSKLWHDRYGHLNYGSLKLLSNKRMVHGLPQIDPVDGVCEDCQFGKQHRSSFPSESSWRAKKPLELIHSDLCGPMPVASFGGNLYFITFIDDFSRKVWVYFLKEKSEAFQAFKDFKAEVEKSVSLPIKSLRTDRGGEYLSNEFQKYCRDHGIKHQLTTRYTPQQNGVSERKNRTIMEMVRCMLKKKRERTRTLGRSCFLCCIFDQQITNKEFEGLHTS